MGKNCRYCPSIVWAYGFLNSVFGEQHQSYANPLHTDMLVVCILILEQQNCHNCGNIELFCYIDQSFTQNVSVSIQPLPHCISSCADYCLAALFWCEVGGTNQRTLPQNNWHSSIWDPSSKIWYRIPACRESTISWLSLPCID